MILLLHVQQKRCGRQYVLRMSPDKVTNKIGDFGKHMGLKLAYVSPVCLSTQHLEQVLRAKSVSDVQLMSCLQSCSLSGEWAHKCCLEPQAASFTARLRSGASHLILFCAPEPANMQIIPALLHLIVHQLCETCFVNGPGVCLSCS